MIDWWRTTLSAGQRRAIIIGAGVVGVLAIVALVTVLIRGDTAPTSTPPIAGGTSTTEIEAASTSVFETTTTTSTLPPGNAVADAGDDALVAVSSVHELDGSGSTDPDDDELSYTWSQTHGSDVTGGTGFLEGESPTFPTPDSVGTLVFQLVVTDVQESVPDEVIVHVLEDPDRAVFVDGEDGDDTNGGNMRGPLATLDAALAVASTGRRDIYLRDLAAGYPSEEEFLVLQPGVSIYGGYETGWIRDPSIRTAVETNHNGLTVLVADEESTVSGLAIDTAGHDVEPVRGLTMVPEEGSSGGTAFVTDVEITTGNATGDIPNLTYALGLADLDTATVTRAVLRPGSAGDGSDGAPGSVLGEAGGDGGTGSGSSGGSGGVGADEAVRGGDGGLGGNALASNGGRGAPGGAGLSGDGSGGAGGDPGIDGASGGQGMGGPGGAGGAGGQTAEDTMVEARGGDGLAGSDGAPGFGGGGGGGGGGLVGLSGGGAGGGGAGGAGGGSGGPGLGGGMSAGLFAENVRTLTVVDSDIAGGIGGIGGNGALGSDGASGGNGGDGAPGSCSFVGCGSGQAGDGGDGGGGGAGGRGGHGGGGGGGPSVGVYVNGTNLILRGGLVAGGMAGNGGSGGFPGNDGGAGDGGSGGSGLEPPSRPGRPGGSGGWSFAIYDASETPGAQVKVEDVELISGQAGSGGNGPEPGSPGIAETTNFE